MPDHIVTKAFKFAEEGIRVIEYVPSAKPQEMSAECAEVAAAEGWIKSPRSKSDDGAKKAAAEAAAAEAAAAEAAAAEAAAAEAAAAEAAAAEAAAAEAAAAEAAAAATTGAA